MFLRATIRKKDGKEHRYFSVVENKRLSGRRVLQRHVLHLGEINSSQELAWRRSIEVLDGAMQAARTLALFPEDRCEGPRPKRIEAGLERMARRIAKSKRRLAPGVLERQIGRLLLERHARAAARYSICIEDDPTQDSGLRLAWTAHPEWDEWANLSEGTYILRSNVHEWSDEELWKTYTQLTEAEAAFRIHKSELAIRPVWHQKTERIKAHILLCFLGYALWKTLQQWQSRAGLGGLPAHRPHRTLTHQRGRRRAARRARLGARTAHSMRCSPRSQPSDPS